MVHMIRCFKSGKDAVLLRNCGRHCGVENRVSQAHSLF